MQSYYTVCSSISISIERLFLQILRDAMEHAAPARGACKRRLLKVHLLPGKKKKLSMFIARA